MEKTAVVFAGLSGIEQAVRSGIIRIPEVSMRVNEAQGILDGLGADQGSSAVVDLVSYLNFNADSGSRYSRLRGLATAVVQVGLWERFLKHNAAPDLLLGPWGAESALRVAVGDLSLSAMIELAVESGGSGLHSNVMPLVRRQPGAEAGSAQPEALQEFRIYQRAERDQVVSELRASTGRYQPAETLASATDFANVFAEALRVGVTNFVVIGACSPVLASYRELIHEPVQIVDSIATDPLLDWFHSAQASLTASAWN